LADVPAPELLELRHIDPALEEDEAVDVRKPSEAADAGVEPSPAWKKYVHDDESSRDSLPPFQGRGG